MNIKHPKIIGIVCGAIISAPWILFATIFGEINHTFKDWLAGIFTHHWIGKSVILIFIIIISGFFGLFIKKITVSTLTFWLLVLFWIILIAITAIILFFAAHTF